MIDLREESAAIRTLAYNGDPVLYLDYMSKNIFQWLSNRDLIGFLARSSTSYFDYGYTHLLV